RIANPRSNGGHGRPDGRFVSPVTTPRRALINPATDQFDLRGREVAVGFWRRHLLIGIVRHQSPDHLTMTAVLRHNRQFAALAPAQSALPCVKSETSLARLLVRSMTHEAVVRKNRQDFERE